MFEATGAAARIAAGFARHDGPREVADLLERLADEQAPVVRTGAAVGVIPPPETRDRLGA